MSYLAGDADGQTPLDHDEAAQLRSASITTRGELDIVEQANIAQATRWAFSRARRPYSILDESFLRRLHKRMFGDVWRWAGDYRRTSRNLGVDWWLVPGEIAQLLGDARYWVDERTYDVDELCVRFHHRLVAIHPFPNGNGRHARLAADILSASLGGVEFGWGRGLDLEPGELRATYIAALQAADAGDPADLIVFARA
jgi:Fic-DOC domain mobile mystery protein B